jgi:hypothetical protein
MSEVPNMPAQRSPDEAEEVWRAIPVKARSKLLSNVWCGHCASTTRIVDYSRKIVGEGDLLLEGRCEKCGRPVARFFESE